MENYDIVVIGTGTSGQTVALELAAEGYSVAIAERSDEPGGVCALHGCQAKKYFYEAAETVARCRHLSGKGIARQPVANWLEVQQHKTMFTSGIPENTVKNLKGNGISYYKGTAEFIAKNTVRIDDREISARYFVIATGAQPFSLPVQGGDQIIYSHEFLALESLPERIAFIGGGFISFEFAHFAAQLGSIRGDVHIFEMANQVLTPFDDDLVNELVAASNQEGIVIYTQANIDSIRRSDAGYVIQYNSSELVEVDLVVNGAGRRPAIDALQLEIAGVDFTPTGIRVDNTMRSTNPSIFAVGDCTATVQLARVADMEATIAAREIVRDIEGGHARKVDYSTVPAVLFTYPQLGMVGKTEKELVSENTKYWRSMDVNLGWPTYRRIGMRHAAYKILVGEDDRILGAHFLSDNTTGLVNTFANAMRNGVTVQQLHESSILSPYPSRESDITYMLASLIE